MGLPRAGRKGGAQAPQELTARDKNLAVKACQEGRGLPGAGWDMSSINLIASKRDGAVIVMRQAGHA